MNFSVPRTVPAALALVCAAALLAGCASLFAPGGAMARLDYPWKAGERQDTLVVMLPGINNSPANFAAFGLVDAVQAAYRADVVAVDASLAYYIDRSVVRRLHDEVVAPARAQGYSKVLALGVSMGGFGALLLSEIHPADLDGVVLLAPFLGEGLIAREMPAAGLPAWRYAADPRNSEQDRKVREIWRMLQSWYAPVDGAPAAPRPELWLAWGADDRMAADAALLAAVLPADQVLTIPGRHDWKTWTKLWGALLPRLGLEPAAKDNP